VSQTAWETPPSSDTVTPMTKLVFLQYGPDDLRPHHVDEVTDHLYVDNWNWMRAGSVPGNRAASRLETDPLPEVPADTPLYVKRGHPKHEWAAQVADEDSYSWGEAQRREMFGD
jgi:hypothetical protein